MMKSGTRTILVLAGVIAVGLTLAGCRADEQDRSISLEKGVYPGPKPAQLSEEQINQLRHRARTQSTN
jgi:hypothetical protein